MMDDILQLIVSIGISCVLVLIILSRPYYGVIFTLVSLPVVDLLPPVPFLTSTVVLIGAITLVGFLLQRKMEGRSPFNFGSVHIAALLFVIWIFISNPQAAWFGPARNWLLTFIQLWTLVWLTGELMDSPNKQHIFMWIFSIVCGVSAIIVIEQGRIGSSLATSLRAGGLADQPNLSARYFIVSMIFFNYLRGMQPRGAARMLASVGVIITFLGVFFTLSRTGILLLIVAVGLQLIFNASRKVTFALVSIYLISAILMWFLSDKIIDIIRSIIPSIRYGADTAGLRYTLWQAGWRMLQDHILQGVGIGMFPEQLRYYALTLSPRYWFLGAHNTYISVLAETGLIGLTIFMVMLALSMRNFSQPNNMDDIKSTSLRYAWLTAFLIVLLGGMTMHGQIDKLLWFLIGMSVYFRNSPVVGNAVNRLGRNIPANILEIPQ